MYRSDYELNDSVIVPGRDRHNLIFAVSKPFEHILLLKMYQEFFIRDKDGQSVTLTTNLHLMLKFRTPIALPHTTFKRLYGVLYNSKYMHFIS
jgi:hypothetical protein